MTPWPKKIGLLNHLGAGNLGDDATLDAVMQNIRSRWPYTEIFGFSMNPSDTTRRHRIAAYPIRTESWNPSALVSSTISSRAKVKTTPRRHRFLAQLLRPIHTAAVTKTRALLREFLFLVKSLRIVKTLNLLVICGGGQLLDSSGGPWKFPYTLFKWVLLARLAGVKCYFVNVGAGPLRYPLSRWFVKRALLFAGYVSFRDDNSRTLIQRIGFSGNSRVVSDCAYSLDVLGAATINRARLDLPIVGFSPMAYCDPRVYWEKDQAVYESFIRKLGSFGSWLIQHDYGLTLFSTDIWFDAQSIEDLRAVLKTGNVGLHRITHKPIREIQELLKHLSSTDYVVTCRFHGVVFAHMLNKPVLAIAHHPKISALMNDLGMERYCLDIRTCDLSVMTETFRSLVSNREEIKSRMAEKLVAYRHDLSIQFDQLFPAEATT